MPRPRTKNLKLFSFLLLSFPLNLFAQEEVEIIGITPFQIIISIAGIIAILMLLVNIVQYLSNGSTSVKAHKKERMALIGLFLAALASWFVLFTTDPDIVAKISFQIDKITSEDSPIPLSFLFKKDKQTNYNTGGGGTRTLQCSDGKDNDGDGLIDYPNDPGCLSVYDDNEYNQPKDEQKQETQCNDGLDNDGDGWIDLKDPGCPNSEDDSESNLPTTYQCSDGKDNDHDGVKDSFDPDCSSYKDNDESTPEKTTQCNDNQDNDSDTWIDLEDPGCKNSEDDSESNSSSLQCNDGLDNDQDGKIDGNDPDCTSALDDSEGIPPPPPPDKKQCEDGLDNDGDGLIDYPNDPGCSSVQDDDEVDQQQNKMQCEDGVDNDSDTWTDLEDPGCSSTQDNDETHTPQYQCSDGLDNDGDGQIDGNDLDCNNAKDNKEGTEPPPSGFPELPEGNGFSGATNDPGPVGSSSDEGYDAKVIARWDVVPFQTINDYLHVGVVAFHMNGIEKVEMSLNGGNWVTINSPKKNPETGISEYTALINSVNSNSDILEVRAIIWPKNAGIPRVLDSSFSYDMSDNGEHSLFLFNGRKITNNDLNLYISQSGNDANPGTQQSPLATITKALQIMKDSNKTGNIILLDPGSYEGPYRNAGHLYYKNNNWITIKPKSGLSKNQIEIKMSSKQILVPQVRLLKWENVTFDFLNISQYYQGNEEMNSWFENVAFYDSSGWTGNPNRLVLVRGQYFFIDGEVHDILYALPQAKIIIGSKVYNISGDALQNSLMILDSEIDNVDGTILSHHTDLYQMFGPMDNLIMYDVIARDLKETQSFFLEPTYQSANGSPRYTLSNAAFVDLKVYNIPIYRNEQSFGGPPWSQMTSSFDHILFDNVLLPNQRFLIRDDKKQGVSNQWWQANNFIVKNSRLHWASYDSYCQGESPEGTMFINCSRSEGEE